MVVPLSICAKGGRVLPGPRRIRHRFCRLRSCHDGWISGSGHHALHDLLLENGGPTLQAAVVEIPIFCRVGIGLMSKGPLALVLTGFPITLWTVWNREWKNVWNSLPWIKGALLMLALSLPWYLLAERQTPGFLHYFIVGEHFQRFTVKGWQGRPVRLRTRFSPGNHLALRTDHVPALDPPAPPSCG